MMFLFHIALSLGLIALTAGVFVYGWSCKVEGTCKCMGKMIGWVIMILASITIVCTIYCGVSAWLGAPMCMHGMDMMHGNAQGGAMMTDANSQNASTTDKQVTPTPEKPKKAAHH